MTDSQLAVGQTLCFVPSQSSDRQPRDVSLSRVGCKFAYSPQLAGLQISLETLKVSDKQGRVYGRCWLSRELHEEDRIRQQTWRRFQYAIAYMYSAPQTLSTEMIQQWLSQLEVRP